MKQKRYIYKENEKVFWERGVKMCSLKQLYKGGAVVECCNCGLKHLTKIALNDDNEMIVMLFPIRDKNYEYPKKSQKKVKNYSRVW